MKDKQEKSNYNKEIPIYKLGHCHLNIEIFIEGIVKLFVEACKEKDKVLFYTIPTQFAVSKSVHFFAC